MCAVGLVYRCGYASARRPVSRLSRCVVCYALPCSCVCVARQRVEWIVCIMHKNRRLFWLTFVQYFRNFLQIPKNCRSRNFSSIYMRFLRYFELFSYNLIAKCGLQMGVEPAIICLSNAVPHSAHPFAVPHRSSRATPLACRTLHTHSAASCVPCQVNNAQLKPRTATRTAHPIACRRGRSKPASPSATHTQAQRTAKSSVAYEGRVEGRVLVYLEN